ncbi:MULTISPECIES: BTAD domain-containing putative transcriptional regulator [Streptomyces]
MTTAVRAGAIDFTLLGPVAARVGGRPVTVTGRRQRVVLALLVLARGRVVPVRTLIDAVWGDRPPLAARAAVTRSVLALRKAFRDAGHTGPLIVATRPGYRLLPGRSGIHDDVCAFEALVAAAEEAAAQEEFEEAATLYIRALALWRGPALDGVGGPATEMAAADLGARRTETCRALLGVGESQFEAGFVDEAETTFQAALCAAEALDDPLPAAEANLALGRLCGTFHRTVRAGRHLAAAQRAFRRAGLEATLPAPTPGTPPLLDLIPRQPGRIRGSAPDRGR